MGNAASEEENVHVPKTVKALFIPAEAVDARWYGSFDIVTEHIEVSTNEEVTGDSAYPDMYGKYYCCSECDSQGKEVWRQETTGNDQAAWSIQWSEEHDAWTIRSGDGKDVYACSCMDQDGISTIPRTEDVQWDYLGSGDAPFITVKFEVAVPVNEEGFPVRLGLGACAEKYFCGRDVDEGHRCGPRNGMQCHACAAFQGHMGLSFRLLVEKAKPKPKEPSAIGAISSLLQDRKDKMTLLEHHGDVQVERSHMKINHVVRTPWLVDNSKMRASTRGLSYRTSKDVTKKALDEVAPWGSIVHGVDMGDNWLVVGQSCSWDTYLPFKVNGIEVLTPQDTPPAMDHAIHGNFKNVSGKLMLSGCGCIYHVTENGKKIYEAFIGYHPKLFQLFLRPATPEGVATEVASVDRKTRTIGDMNFLKLQVSAESGLDTALVLTICLATLRQLPAHDDTTFDETKEMLVAEQAAQQSDQEDADLDVYSGGVNDSRRAAANEQADEHVEQKELGEQEPEPDDEEEVTI